MARGHVSIIIALLAAAWPAMGCKHEQERRKQRADDLAPAADDAAAIAADKAFVTAEAAFQATVADGTPEAFAAAASALREAGLQIEKQPPDARRARLVAQVSYATGMISPVDAKAAADKHVRRILAQTIHERVTRLALAPLPYPADPALTKDNAELVAASERPHGGFDEALRSVTSVVNRLCACTDKACAQTAYHDFKLWGMTYGDITTTSDQAAQITAIEGRVVGCYKQATGAP